VQGTWKKDKMGIAAGFGSCQDSSHEAHDLAYL
jgi:hypothetical protein